MFLIHYMPQSLNLGSMAIFWRFVCGSSVPYVGRRAKRLVKSWRINKRMYYTAALYCKGPCRTQTKCLHGPKSELRSLSISELVWGLQSYSRRLWYLSYLKRSQNWTVSYSMLVFCCRCFCGRTINCGLQISRATFKRQSQLTKMEAAMSPSWGLQHSNGIHFTTEQKVKSARQPAPHSPNQFHKEQLGWSSHSEKSQFHTLEPCIGFPFKKTGIKFFNLVYDGFHWKTLIQVDPLSLLLQIFCTFPLYCPKIPLSVRITNLYSQLKRYNSLTLMSKRNCWKWGD